jgi:hypothetical protein
MNIRSAEAASLAEQIAQEILDADTSNFEYLQNFQSDDDQEVVLTAGYDSDGMPQAELGHVDFVGSWLNAYMSWSAAREMTKYELAEALASLIEDGLDADADADAAAA